MGADSEEAPGAGGAEREQGPDEVIELDGEGQEEKEQEPSPPPPPDYIKHHSICKRPYDSRVWEEYGGGKAGQAASPVWAFVVRQIESPHGLKCLICGEQTVSPTQQNFKTHLRTHAVYRKHEEDKGKGASSSGGGAGAGAGAGAGGAGGAKCETCGRSGTRGLHFWSNEKRDKLVRIIAAYMVVNGRYVRCLLM
jgi:hypothetical protein